MQNAQPQLPAEKKIGEGVMFERVRRITGTR